MASAQTRCSALLAGLLSAACGGGGGASDGSWLKFYPSPVQVEGYADGVPVRFTVVARSTRTIARTVNIGVVDTLGRIDPAISVSATGNLEYTATLATSATLAAGIHEGSLEVRVCYDNPITCNQPVEGSPWRLPYRFTLRGPDLTPLAELAGWPGWPTPSGDATHGARVPASFDVAKATRRWWARIPDWDIYSPTIVVDAGRVFLLDLRGSVLHAFSEDDGSPLWSHDFGVGPATNGAKLSAPAAAHGKVYVRALDSEAVWAIDQATGATAWTLTLPSGARGGLPTPYLDALYVSYAGYGNASGRSCYTRIRPSDGASLWTACPAQTFGRPSIRDGIIYDAASEAILALDTADGRTLWSATAPRVLTPSPAVLVGDHLVCRRSGDACADLATHAIAPYRSTPGFGLGNGILGSSSTAVYEVQEYLTLLVRDPVTGALLWSARSTILDPPAIVTDNLLLVSGVVFDLERKAALPPNALAPVRAISGRGVGYSVDYVPGIGFRLIAVNLR